MDPADVARTRSKAELDSSQAWFWTPSWQEGEREAEQDVAEGRVSTYGNDDFLASLAGCHRRPTDIFDRP